MKLLPLLLILTLQTFAEKHDAELIRVVDGDTIQVLYKDKKEKVRLLFVNTPESVHRDKSKNTPEGEKASKALKEKLKLVTKLKLEFDEDEEKRDRYGRLLCYVWVGDEMINLWIIKEGHSEYYTKYGKSKKYKEEFEGVK